MHRIDRFLHYFYFVWSEIGRMHELPVAICKH